VWIEVFHDDRDIEFIQFKRWLERLYNEDVIQLNNKSCEMIADDLAAEINIKYPGRWIKVSVAEDNENGCEMEYPVYDGDGPNFDVPSEELEDVFDSLKKEKKMENHLKLKALFEEYQAEQDKFENSGVKASAARARKALMEISKLCKVRRGEIQDKKNSM
jgi:hypothetical protein